MCFLVMFGGRLIGWSVAAFSSCSKSTEYLVDRLSEAYEGFAFNLRADAVDEQNANLSRHASPR
ncbi:hypothetical protein B5V03_02280 [Bradyrhizobium betae]|uniref:Uncharacterized protein n=1 Tax=Bradyrhizobium betae TaxID=244734 RepID=A0A4Q1VU54_9BRAD|nr:hypothetical protein B5V03_02280 [Bradyrhizobium betae]